MKARILLIALASATAASAATYTYSSNWNVTVNQDIVGTTLNAFASQGSTTTVNLPYYDGTLHPGETLTGVTISYKAPQTSVSPTITATISSATGDNHFSTVTESVSTTIDSPTLTILLGGDAVGVFDPDSFTKTKSQNVTDYTILAGSTLALSLSRTYNVTQYTAPDWTSANLFNQSGNFSFSVGTSQGANYTRDANADDVNFHYAGIDSGTITVTYTTVPEPAAALLGGIGVLALLRRRR